MDINDVIMLARSGFSRAEINSMLSAQAPAVQQPATFQAAPAIASAAATQFPQAQTVPAAPAPSPQTDRLGQLIQAVQQQQQQTGQVLQAIQQNAIQQGYQPQPAETIEGLTARIINPGTQEVK